MQSGSLRMVPEDERLLGQAGQRARRRRTRRRRESWREAEAENPPRQRQIRDLALKMISGPKR